MADVGRPLKEFDRKSFVDLVGLGCSQQEICWFFRDETGKPANVDTLSRWCKREFGMNFQEYSAENSGMALKIRLRRNQVKLSEKSAAMAIFLGKNYLKQTDSVIVENPAQTSAIEQIAKLVLGDPTQSKQEDPEEEEKE